MSVEKMSLTSSSASGGSFSPTNRAVTLDQTRKSRMNFLYNMYCVRNSIFSYVCTMREKYYLTPVCRFRKLWSSLASSTFDLNNRHVQNTITVKHTAKARNTDPLMNKRRPNNWRSNSVYCCSISNGFTWLLLLSHPPLHPTSLASS